MVIIQFEQLTALAASTGRLQTLLSALQVGNQDNELASTIKIVGQPQIEINHLTLKIPLKTLNNQP